MQISIPKTIFEFNMSTNIPFDIQVNIIKRVFPVKPLIRFRSVSKQWKSLIDSSEFITDHSVNQTRPHHILVSYKVALDKKYVSFVDDGSFPPHKFSPIVSPTLKLLNNASILGCSHGLVALYGFRENIKNPIVVVWNPSIGKSGSIVLPKGIYVVGFGVCPKTNHPKIVTITTCIYEFHTVEWEVEVFTLGCGGWRYISMNLDLPPSLDIFKSSQVEIDGVIYWVVDYDDVLPMIISFDLTSEKFRKLDLPDTLTRKRLPHIFRLKDSLAVVSYDIGDAFTCEIWMMMIKNGGPKCLSKKLFTYSWPNQVIIMGFTKNGQPLITCFNGDEGFVGKTLQVYDPSAQSSNKLGFDANCANIVKVTSYIESLLLLDHSESLLGDEDGGGDVISSCI